MVMIRSHISLKEWFSLEHDSIYIYEINFYEREYEIIFIIIFA